MPRVGAGPGASVPGDCGLHRHADAANPHANGDNDPNHRANSNLDSRACSHANGNAHLLTNFRAKSACSDSRSHSATGSYPSGDALSSIDANGDALCRANGGPRPHANSRAHAVSNANGNAYANGNSYFDAHAHTHTDTISNTNSDADSHPRGGCPRRPLAAAPVV